MKKYSNITASAIGSISLALLSQSAMAEQKYTVPSTPGAANTHTMPSGHNSGHNMQHTQGGSTQHTQGGHAGHKMPKSDPVHGAGKTGKIPTETGQSAFAAIAEIVAILNADPNTDWSKVNISALRRHLVDMNELTLNATATQKMTPNAVTFTIAGTGKTVRAIHAMVPAHSAELAKLYSWNVSVTKSDTGAVLVITSGDETQITKINALGFFGIMALGGHHQPHHFGMATGQMVHQH